MRAHELDRYHSLLADLERWVISTHEQLKLELPKFNSVGAVLNEMDASKVRNIKLIVKLFRSRITHLANRSWRRICWIAVISWTT